jgi:tRNA pseudouridine55 synthase
MSRQRKKKGRPVSGWIILDKPFGVGSTECVSRIKWLYQAAKCGHAGTLDPLASGMLPIALGEATKTVPYVMDGEKTYRFTVTWGAETNTDDLEGEVMQSSAARPSAEAIAAILPAYLGEIEQVPPAYSAVKINGERAYNLAREGAEVEIQPRAVMIHRLEILETRGDEAAVFECQCGKGTYVRALARDMGRQLGCFGHVSELRRTGVGPFGEEDMVQLSELESREGDLAALDEELLPTGVALDDLPEISVTSDQAHRIRAGNSVLLRGRDALANADEAVAILGTDLVAIGHVERGEFHPKRVFTVSRS